MPGNVNAAGVGNAVRNSNTARGLIGDAKKKGVARGPHQPGGGSVRGIKIRAGRTFSFPDNRDNETDETALYTCVDVSASSLCCFSPLFVAKSSPLVSGSST